MAQLWKKFTALTCLPMFGDTDAIKFTFDKTDEKKLEALNNSYSRSMTLYKCMYLLYLRHFKAGKGQNSEDELEAMLAYSWL